MPARWPAVRRDLPIVARVDGLWSSGSRRAAVDDSKLNGQRGQQQLVGVAHNPHLDAADTFIELVRFRGDHLSAMTVGGRCPALPGCNQAPTRPENRQNGAMACAHREVNYVEVILQPAGAGYYSKLLPVFAAINHLRPDIISIDSRRFRKWLVAKTGDHSRRIGVLSAFEERFSPVQGIEADSGRSGAHENQIGARMRGKL